ncbi:hypothetical protein MT997_21610 [Paenibacillus sp. OVF10]|nr:hypothetical protein MT997_21610 [Paenibacillus sp. OVF10]
MADVSHIGPGMIPHYLSMFEGVSILSALSMVTHSIGLTATIATSYADPFTVARQIASLKESRSYAMKKEFLEIVEGLWDSYKDDAFSQPDRW